MFVYQRVSELASCFSSLQVEVKVIPHCPFWVFPIVNAVSKKSSLSHPFDGFPHVNARFTDCFFFTYDLEIVEIIYTGNTTFKQQDPWVFSCKHQPKRNIRKIMGQKQNIITNPAFSLWEAKKRRLLRDTVPQLISWKQHKKRRLSQFPVGELWFSGR